MKSRHRIGPCTAMVQSTVRELQLSRSVKFFYPYPSIPFHVIIFYFLALTGNYGKSNSVYCITVVSILKFLETCIHFSNFLHCLFIADISLSSFHSVTVRLKISFSDHDRLHNISGPGRQQDKNWSKLLYKFISKILGDLHSYLLN